jgi:hypothetical protein
MNLAWASSIDQFWRAPSLPMWVTLAAAAGFAVILLITLMRAEKSVANGALTVITLLAIGIAVAATIRGFGPEGGVAFRDDQPAIQAPIATLPALSCIDELAGETVLTSCEKTLFGSAETVAAAVSYAAARVSRLTELGDVATAQNRMTPDLERLRRSIERDRYGLTAYVLSARDHCQPTECAAYRSLTDHNQIAANMEERLYEGLVLRYAPSWNAPASPAIAGLAPQLPTGKPTTADFPSSASIPPVNIMTPEPTVAPSPPRPPVNAAIPSPGPRPPAATGATSNTANAQAAPHPVAAKKPAVQKPKTTAPVQLAPAAADLEN